MANGISGLSSPLVVLGALWYAGENRREFTGGMDGIDILAGGFGASSAQWAGEQLQNAVGGDTLTPLLSQALVGAGVSNYGGMIPQNQAIARGIHLNVAQQAFSDAGFAAGDLLGDIGGIGGGNGGNSGNSGTEAQDMSANQNTGTASTSAADLVGA